MATALKMEKVCLLEESASTDEPTAAPKRGKRTLSSGNGFILTILSQLCAKILRLGFSFSSYILVVSLCQIIQNWLQDLKFSRWPV